MREITINSIDMGRKELTFQGFDREVIHTSAPNPVATFRLRGELMDATGTAHLLEDERAALLALITRIEERLMEDSQGRA